MKSTSFKFLICTLIYAMQALKNKKVHYMNWLFYGMIKYKVSLQHRLILMFVNKALFIVCMMHHDAHSFVSLHCMADQKFIPPPFKGFFYAQCSMFLIKALLLHPKYFFLYKKAYEKCVMMIYTFHIAKIKHFHIFQK